MAVEKNVQGLEEWLRKQPGSYLHPNLHVANDEQQGVHWRASGPVEAGVNIVTVPHSAALSYLNALADDAFPVFKQRRAEFKIEAIGFFYLMLQYLNKSTSFWKPWLETLPRPEDGHTTPLWFDSPEDEAWLADTDALFTAKKLKTIYEEQYRSGIATLKKAGIDTEPLTWDFFRWAITMFSSRSFSSRSITPQGTKYWTTYKNGPEGQRQAVLMDLSHAPSADLDFSVMFPVLDAANHHHTARVDWTFDPGRFSLASRNPISAGEEVYNSYGPKSNEELLTGYGFCLPDNPNDAVLLTLKPPPEELQATLRKTHSGFFLETGVWNSDKATFKLRRPTRTMAQSPTAAFDDLPEPLLELLTQIIRFDRGLPFTPLPSISQYLKDDPTSPGPRYLPFIARMIVTSLAPKYQKLQAGSQALAQGQESGPQNPRQSQAQIYRESQISILLATINSLRSFLRIFRPASEELPREEEVERLNPAGARVVTLEEGLDALLGDDGSEVRGSFMAGVRANANTTDLEQLRLAGWEEDAWVLLLCFAWLARMSGRLGGGQAGKFIAELEGEYEPAGLLGSGPGEEGTSVVQGEASSEAGDMMGIVQKAAKELPGSLWADERWSERLIAGFGGRVLKNESFMMMVADQEGRGEEARLVVYLHSR